LAADEDQHSVGEQPFDIDRRKSISKITSVPWASLFNSLRDVP
jgi:hypothetical protein